MQTTIEQLEKRTPIIEEDFNYESELVSDEIRDFEKQIAELTIEIETKSIEAQALRSEIKSADEHRKTLADILNHGKLDRTAEQAVKFYDKDENTIEIHVKENGVWVHLLTREAYSTEVEQWRKLQDQIAQQEIEAGEYRQKLQKLAE
jgi:hypothetical protein